MRTMAKTKHRQKKSFNLMTPLILIAAVAVIAFSINLSSTDLREQEQIYLEREADLQEQIKAEQKRTEELEQQKKHVGMKQYIEEVARDRLGLIDPDEVLIKENDD